MSVFDNPIGIAAVPNSRYLGVREMTFKGNITKEEVYSGDYLILALGDNGILKGYVLDYTELEMGQFTLFVDELRNGSESKGIVNLITKKRIEDWIETYTYTYACEELDNPIEGVLDVIYSHVYKNLNITPEAKAYLETLKKQINYKKGKDNEK